jgi:hypothetical protein
MDAVTYPDKAVADFASNAVIPLRIPSDSEPLASQFMIKWTPTLVVLDASGKERWRSVGFIPAEEFVSTILLGVAKTYFDADQLEGCLKALDRIVTEFPKSCSAPEAVFWKGVAGYKSTHDPKPLRQAYDRLAAEFPASRWTQRALPYRLIPL